MKNNRILSLVLMGVLLIGASCLMGMEQPLPIRQYPMDIQHYNGFLNEEEAFANALRESTMEAERVASIVYDAAMNIQLPNDLRNKHVTHLEVSRQNDSTSCGYHSIFNAWALQELVARGRLITGKDVQQLAMQHHGLIVPEHLLEIAYSEDPEKPDCILDIAKRLNLPANLYFLSYVTQGNKINGKVFNVAGTHETLNHDYVEFLQTIRYRDYEGVLVGHIICNYNNAHWVTFSVVKKPGQEPEIYYMNSTNASLEIDSYAYAVAKHIVELVG